MRAAFYKGEKTIVIGECTPESPGPGEVRLSVAYCGICGTDLHIFLGQMDKRVHLPQVIGHEMSGEIAELGRGVTGWSVGDRVVVRPLQACGKCPACRAGNSHICYNLKFMGIDTPGAFQGSWTVPTYTLHRVPPSVSLAQAALTEPLAVACHDVRRGQVLAGEKVVVIGSGPIGLLIALVARFRGAQVVVSEVNPFRLRLAQSLGIEAINPMETDLVSWVEKKTEGAGADVVFEVSGSPEGAAAMTKLARTRGRIVVVAIFSEAPRVELFRFFWRELELKGARVYEPEDFDTAIQTMAQGRLPIDNLISAVRPLEDLQKVLSEIESGADLVKVLINTHGG